MNLPDTQPEPERPDFLSHLSARDLALSLWDWTMLARAQQFTKLREQFHLIHYALQHYSRGSRRIPIVDIQALIDQWKEAIVILTTAHSKDAVDKAEFALDELLTPFLKAPIKQIREFYHGLCAAIQADERVPFFVWRLLAVLGEDIDKIDKDEIVELKTALATKIAQMVESDVKPDLVEALTGALKWRSAESLTKIKAAVESGEKPRLKGRESCLFLVAGDEEVML